MYSPILNYDQFCVVLKITRLIGILYVLHLSLFLNVLIVMLTLRTVTVTLIIEPNISSS